GLNALVGFADKVKAVAGDLKASLGALSTLSAALDALQNHFTASAGNPFTLTFDTSYRRSAASGGDLEALIDVTLNETTLANITGIKPNLGQLSQQLGIQIDLGNTYGLTATQNAHLDDRVVATEVRSG